MLIRLSKHVYVRQYGDYTYVVDKTRYVDRAFLHAEIFFRWISREPRDVEDIVKNICGIYCKTPEGEIRRDFGDFKESLLSAGLVVSGESVEELNANEAALKYDSSVANRFSSQSKESGNQIKMYLDEYFKHNPSAMNFQIELTDACTERCVHCYIPKFGTAQLSYETVIRVIKEFRNQGGIHLSLSGGECLLHPYICKIIRFAYNQDLAVTILSNLTLCNDNIVSCCRDCDVTVQVSLYSMNQTVHDEITRLKGSFEKTKASIEALRNAGVSCFISCPTMRQNYSDYLEVLSYARSLGMDAQTDFIIMGKKDCDTSNLKNRLDVAQTRKIIEDVVCRSLPTNSEYFSPGRKENMMSDCEFCHSRVCGAGSSLICLDAYGRYHPCPSLEGVTLGSCYEHDMRWILQSSPETLRMRNITGSNFGKCKSCECRDYCTICMCRNYNETGDLFTPSPYFCEVAKINKEVVNRYQAGLLE